MNRHRAVIAEKQSDQHFVRGSGMPLARVVSERGELIDRDI